MTKKTSPKSDCDSTNKTPPSNKLDKIQKEIKKLHNEFKSSKKKMSSLEKENKELKTNLSSIIDWKKKYDSIDKNTNIDKDTISENIPYILETPIPDDVLLGILIGKHNAGIGYKCKTWDNNDENIKYLKDIIFHRCADISKTKHKRISTIHSA